MKNGLTAHVDTNFSLYVYDMSFTDIYDQFYFFPVAHHLKDEQCCVRCCYSRQTYMFCFFQVFLSSIASPPEQLGQFQPNLAHVQAASQIIVKSNLSKFCVGVMGGKTVFKKKLIFLSVYQRAVIYLYFCNRTTWTKT